MMTEVVPIFINSRQRLPTWLIGSGRNLAPVSSVFNRMHLTDPYRRPARSEFYQGTFHLNHSAFFLIHRIKVFLLLHQHGGNPQTIGDIIKAIHAAVFG